MTLSPPIPLDEAQDSLFNLAQPLSVEHVDMEGSLRRYLATPLLARRTQPAQDLSSMDGYAVADGDMSGPWTIIGESAAGHPFTGSLQGQDAIRVSTGALLPAGAYCVLLQEDVNVIDGSVHLDGDLPHPLNRYIRPCGLDFADGIEVLPAGTKIGPAQIALAIAAGHTHLPVHRMPRIAIIDSGDELSPDPECCAAHQIPASNGAMLQALAQILPVETTYIGPVKDNLQALLAALDTVSDADIIVTSGGASVGDHDLIRPALEDWGATLNFWRVAIKPGKPLLVATRHRANTPNHPQIILGLPGNPVSSFVTGFHFLLPLLRRLLGATAIKPIPLIAKLSDDLPSNGPRQEFLRGHWNGQTVTPHSTQDSSALLSLANSNVLINRPSFAPAATKGAEVEIYLLENGGIA